jgi:hypothetical protein
MPARTADSGVPPTATQTGSGSCKGRGYTPCPPGVVPGLADVQQSFEFLGEKPVVVAEVVAEERERLDEGSAPDHDLRAPARDEVERRELLEDADRVVRAQDGDGARESDALRPRGDGGEHDGRRRDGEVGPMVLTDAEDVEADLVRELGFLDHLAQALLGALALAGVREREDADLHAEVLPVWNRATVDARRR